MPSWARAALLALLGTLLLASVAAAPGTAATAAEDGNLTYEIRLESDGDARWTVRVQFSLDSAAERTAFRTLADEYERGETRALGLESFRTASQQAARVTGRQMAITDVRRGSSPESAIENGNGWLSLSFTWTNFARVTEENDLVVGDAFNTTSGTWLARLGASETLVITPPESHNPFDGDCALAERSFRCEGPLAFDAGSPHAEFTADGTSSSGGFLVPGFLVAGLAVLLLAVFLVARRRDGLPRPTDLGEGEDGDVTTESDTPDDGDDETTADDEPDVDLELLSDEERVERLLERNGGRMKQASIVKETGWSNAKVSQLLSAMEEEDRIDKLRIGRENLISFPDEDVTDIDE